MVVHRGRRGLCICDIAYFRACKEKKISIYIKKAVKNSYEFFTAFLCSLFFTAHGNILIELPYVGVFVP